ncbi:hypothetical protein EYF80_018793 [Liparis tanakae]|uniref:Uncharacterized protein n=1 Tax=Liparis tanakae TaxID=230148 RepID=A0A4Z2HZ11_9TELE|nr:hypothetical protein EYF80_018793 [Liparis tanakae]
MASLHLPETQQLKLHMSLTGDWQTSARRRGYSHAGVPSQQSHRPAPANILPVQRAVLCAKLGSEDFY